ncbi:putative glutathione S-transferase parA [Cinnamomum micranthum f. kanehirae]|uniref:Putative glutathione S-transferase parA n=1 Tax=Cinnamomum micranthum f. kanehirae TaxID=337451 RepID=A0A3S3N402_9MAGN|nr:putative glutathione S-transferase parA [Cinnamomum micranthum f. kanehirae]
MKPGGRSAVAGESLWSGRFLTAHGVPVLAERALRMEGIEREFLMLGVVPHPKDVLHFKNKNSIIIFYIQIYECGLWIWKSKGEAQDAAKKESIDCLKLLEGELEGKPFYGVKSLGYVDVVFVPFACWFYTYETNNNFKIENECPKLIALVKRCMEKETVSMVLSDPHKVFDFVGDLKKCGVEF